jgi:hypothetical protein
LPTISSPTNMLNQSYYGTFGITPEQAPNAI